MGNSRTPPLFKIPIPSSRATVPTGYGYVLPDQNGWSRYLHFEAAWALVLTGLVYVISGLWTRHFRKNLFPAPADRTWGAFRSVIAKHLRLAPPDEANSHSYNVQQNTCKGSLLRVGFGFISPNGCGALTRFAGHITQGSKRIPIHLLPSERSQRYRDR